ncbi:MAG: HlyD family secretion protein [Gammaproteobacteria bacterium]|nr:HlyD family secretion protein [Gammaproteobacteria bacterium]
MSENTTDTPDAPAEEKTVKKAKPRSGFSRFVRKSMRLGLLMLGPVVILGVGGYYYATSGRIVNTENAYVKSDHILVSADIDGRVVEVNVRNNQPVTKGMVLFRIDRKPFEIRVSRVEAELANVDFEIAAYRAAYREAQAELTRAQKDVAHLQREYVRRQTLAERNILAKSEAEKFRYEWQTAKGNIGSLREKSVGALSNLGGKVKMKTEDHPRYKRRLAELEEAKLDLARTVVRAPADGVVSNVELQRGEYVESGKAVFSLLSIDPVWIEANLKETQLTHVKVGQEATLTVDAYPDYDFRARVASVSPGTGAEFSILPAQNATGNWVKVVQRIPVKLELEPDENAPQLRAGMSVTVKIDTEHERKLPQIVQSALALVGYREAEKDG